jgi:formylglycine-generating enzyme required for sulfatase activity
MDAQDDACHDLLERAVELILVARLDEALGCLNNALETNPRFWQAWVNKGVVLAEQGLQKEALGCFGKGIEIKPSEPKPWLNQGLALLDLQDYPSGELCFVEANNLGDPLSKTYITHCRERFSGRSKDQVDRPPLALRLFRRQLKSDKDGTRLVFIPAGEFLVGPSKRAANLDAFYLASHTVTNNQYKTFVDETGHRIPRGDLWAQGTFPAGKGDHPVVYVNSDDAEAYCEWAGLRLPTLLEWEKGARGINGQLFPWGNDWDDSKVFDPGNYRDTTSVFAFPNGCSPYGLYQMRGNIWEWTADEFNIRRYERERDPFDLAEWWNMGSSASPRLVQGERGVSVGRGDCGSFDGQEWSFLYYLHELALTATQGFRCAKDAE